MQAITTKATYIRIDGADRVCANCEHFQQHYVKGNFYYGGFAPVNSGHCCLRRPKARCPGDSCEEFEAKEKIV